MLVYEILLDVLRAKKMVSQIVDSLMYSTNIYHCCIKKDTSRSINS